MMRRPKSRKAPLTETGSTRSGVSRSKAQAIISGYHVSLKNRRRGRAGGAEDIAAVDEPALLQYQQYSQIGQSAQRGGDSSKVLVPWLRDRRSQTTDTLRMLEIGAVRHDNYAAQSWIDNHPIDLLSQHPSITQQDFFELNPQSDYDILSCSLVLNFVDDPVKRGSMLQLAHRHLRPSSASLFFLVLPLPCVTNSRYLTRSSMLSIMTNVGFELVKERSKPGGKVGYWLWAWRKPKRDPSSLHHSKEILNDGPRRNNFSILLPKDA